MTTCNLNLDFFDSAIIIEIKLISKAKPIMRFYHFKVLMATPS